MSDIDMQDLLNKTGSVYKLVILASRRALELSEGAMPLVSGKGKDTAGIALEEIAGDKVKWRYVKEEK